ANAPATTTRQTTGTGGTQDRPDPHFRNCKEATAAGYGPYYKDRHEEYHYYNDVDKDGVACDPQDLK
ncbi:excalibur calcium-binding domain-containing protein, partial [Nonomuraea sp. NN258]|uniref:excalibur calcium-binding domain-containing protein n=1 Tax=Nonomuraea antri TaxID=2730852 RepID=UPI001569B973